MFSEVTEENAQAHGSVDYCVEEFDIVKTLLGDAGTACRRSLDSERVFPSTDGTWLA